MILKKKGKKVTFRPTLKQDENVKKPQKNKKADKYVKSEDEYQNEIIGEIVLTPNKSKVVFSICRNGEYGLHHFDMRLHVNTAAYVGPTKVGIQLPMNKLDEVLSKLNDIYDVAEERNLFEEFEGEE